MMRVTRFLFTLLCIVTIASFVPEVDAVESTRPMGSLQVREQSAPGDYPLVVRQKAAPVWVDQDDFKVVRIAAELFAKDVERVSGARPALINSKPSEAKTAVLIGTLGHSALIDQLVAEKKLDVSAIRGHWESYLVATVKNPLPNVKSALVIVGSDRRGTAYGVFTVSEAMGVSPWYWWADVTPAKRSQLFVSSGVFVQGSPSVKYRGIFINDEFKGLHPWSSRTFEKERKHIGPKTYAKVFELLLRLKANLCWPAMWDGARYFNIYPENKFVADDYGIVMGSSHCEPLLFNNAEGSEWDEATQGPWNFLTNPDRICKAWEGRLKENGKFENVYTIGLRGVSDRPIQGGNTIEEKAAILQKAIDAQRVLLGRNVNNDVASVPQIFCPYREVLKLYEAGLKVPDDVTLVWADDNYGYMRPGSTPEEQKRSGRSGVYYHIGFFSYVWLCPRSPAQIAFEMSKAYATGADRLWVFNVGDIKPAEKELTFAMQMAWDIHRWSPQNTHCFMQEWAAKTFGAEFAADITSIMQEYYRLAARGMPEFLNRGSKSCGKYSHAEMAARLASCRNLSERVQRLAQRIPTPLQDAFFQLVLYPVRGAELINERAFLAQQSLELAARGDDRALEIAAQARQAGAEVQKITHHYNQEMANGKWNHMMDGTPIEDVTVATPELVQQGKEAVAHGGNECPVPAFIEIEPDPVMVLPAFAFARKHDAKDGVVNVCKGLGYSDGVSLFPFTAPSLDDAHIGENAWVEYDLDLPLSPLGIQIRTLPTQRVHSACGLRYGVSINGNAPQIFDIHYSEGEGAWWENIKRGFSFRTLPYGADQPRKLKLRLYLPDPGVVLQDIRILTNPAPGKSKTGAASK